MFLISLLLFLFLQFALTVRRMSEKRYAGPERLPWREEIQLIN